MPGVMPPVSNKTFDTTNKMINELLCDLRVKYILVSN